MSIEQILEWIGLYGYLVIFPLAIIEGPVVTILTGFLTSLGRLNFLAVYLIFILGDLIGDSVLYYLGYRLIGKRIPSWLKFFGVTNERYLDLKSNFRAHPKKILLLGKFLYGIGSVTIFMAGSVRLRYKTFLGYDLIFTSIKSFIFLLIGYFFGSAYILLKHEFDLAAILVTVLFLLSLGLFILYSRIYLKNEHYIKN